MIHRRYPKSRGLVPRLVIPCLLLWSGDSVPADMVPFGANSHFDTSEYALGSHTLNVVFIQDDQLRDPNNNTHPVIPGGQIIHWTASELASRSQRVINAAAFWTGESAARHHPGARLDVSVNFVNGGNPITVANIGDEGSTVGYGDALTQLDPLYAMYTDFTAVQHFNHNIRQDMRTHWASTVFIKPYNGRASAYVNGPLVNAYEDDSAWTHAHEYGHTFGSRDEYGSANTGTRSGYLHAFNTNAANLPDGSPNPNSIPAVMKTRDVYTISDGTINQIGWRDADNDTVPDILDTFPTLELDTSSSDPALGLALIALSSDVTPLPSPDPSEGDFTINTISAAEYRVNDGTWFAIASDDGIFGDYAEVFSFELASLPYGNHDVDLRVFNSVDNFSDAAFSFFSLLVTPDFNGDGSYDCADVDGLVAEIVAGTNGAGFDLDGDGQVDTVDLDEWLAQAGAFNLPSGNAYLPGDANLDGTVDGSDFIAWNDHKFTATAAWCSGDFSADGFVDGSDFVRWNENRFSTSGIVAVPEPSGWLVGSLLLLGIPGIRQTGTK